MADLHLKVLSLAETVLEAEQILWVRLKLSNEKFLTVYPRHAPLLAQTLPGELLYHPADAPEARSLAAGPGLLSIRDDQVTLLIGETYAATAADAE